MSGSFGDGTPITSLEDILGLPLGTSKPPAAALGYAAAAGSAAPTPPFLSLKEASVFLSVSLSTLNRLLARGELVALRIGRRRKIPADNLRAYLTRDANAHRDLNPKRCSQTTSVYPKHRPTISRVKYVYVLAIDTICVTMH